MIVVGLTGGIGAGKTAFASQLAERGVRVVDVDALGREVIAPGTAGGDAVHAAFGTTDRRELAGIVFADAQRRRRLESISWPLIEERLRSLIADAGDAGDVDVVVLDMAVLAQGLGKGIYGPVVTVEAPDDVRLARLVARGLTEDDALARMRAQTSEAERRAMADVVVVNDGSWAALSEAADELLRHLRTGGFRR
jgi:dephospho-CoA kinase